MKVTSSINRDLKSCESIQLKQAQSTSSNLFQQPPSQPTAIDKDKGELFENTISAKKLNQNQFGQTIPENNDSLGEDKSDIFSNNPINGKFKITRLLSPSNDSNSQSASNGVSRIQFMKKGSELRTNGQSRKEYVPFTSGDKTRNQQFQQPYRPITANNPQSRGNHGLVNLNRNGGKS